MGQKLIGHIVATVRLPIYEADVLPPNKTVANWFEFRQPGITDGGDIGVCKREVELVSQQFEAVETVETA